MPAHVREPRFHAMMAAAAARREAGHARRSQMLAAEERPFGFYARQAWPRHGPRLRRHTYGFIPAQMLGLWLFSCLQSSHSLVSLFQW